GKLTGKKHAADKSATGDDGRHLYSIEEGLFHPGIVAGSVVVAYDWLCTLIQSHHSHHNDAQHGVADPVCAYGQVSAIFQQGGVEQNRHARCCHLHKEGGESDRDDSHDDLPVQPNVLLPYPDHAGFLCKMVHYKQHADKHGDNCGPGNAGDAEVKYKNEYRVEDDIQYSANQHGNHRFAGISRCAHHVVEAVTETDEEVSDQNDLQILPGIGQCVLRSSECQQDLVEINIKEGDDHSVEQKN